MSSKLFKLNIVIIIIISNLVNCMIRPCDINMLADTLYKMFLFFYFFLDIEISFLNYDFINSNTLVKLIR